MGGEEENKKRDSVWGKGEEREVGKAIFKESERKGKMKKKYEEGLQEEGKWTEED